MSSSTSVHPTTHHTLNFWSDTVQGQKASSSLSLSAELLRPKQGTRNGTKGNPYRRAVPPRPDTVMEPSESASTLASSIMPSPTPEPVIGEAETKEEMAEASPTSSIGLSPSYREMVPEFNESRIDCLGNEREKIHVKSVQKSYVPSAPHREYLKAEHGTRRRVNISSTGRTLPHEVLSRSHGSRDNLTYIQGEDMLHVLPNIVDFGSLKFGETRERKITMLNKGNYGTRFKVLPPAPRKENQLRVSYDKGAVYPGLSAAIRIKLEASAAGEIIDEVLEIVSEDKLFYVAITGQVV